MLEVVATTPSRPLGTWVVVTVDMASSSWMGSVARPGRAEATLFLYDKTPSTFHRARAALHLSFPIIVIPSRLLLASEESGRAMRNASRFPRGDKSHVWRASLQGELKHRPRAVL